MSLPNNNHGIFPVADAQSTASKNTTQQAIDTLAEAILKAINATLVKLEKRIGKLEAGGVSKETVSSSTASGTAENAKRLDGILANKYALKTDTVANASKLGGKSADEYALKADPVENANRLGGVAAAEYALKTDTVADASKLGGTEAEAYALKTDVSSAITNSISEALEDYQTEEETTKQIISAIEEREVQTNWEEWDETNKAFLQNKPFYDSRREVLALDNVTITVPYDSYDNILFPIDEGQNFKVTIDGVLYEVPLRSTSSGSAVLPGYGSTNIKIYTVSAGDYTFKKIEYIDFEKVRFLVNGINGEHVVSVSYQTGELKRFDSKYLPNDVLVLPATKANEGKVPQVVSQQWVASQIYCDTVYENILLTDYTFEIPEGSTYLELDHTLFEIKFLTYQISINDALEYEVGTVNMTMNSDPINNTYCLKTGILEFQDYYNKGTFRIVGDPGTYTISVKETGGKFVQVEEKFIPDTIARMSDIDALEERIAALEAIYAQSTNNT